MTIRVVIRVREVNFPWRWHFQISASYSHKKQSMMAGDKWSRGNEESSSFAKNAWSATVDDGASGRRVLTVRTRQKTFACDGGGSVGLQRRQRVGPNGTQQSTFWMMKTRARTFHDSPSRGTSPLDCRDDSGRGQECETRAETENRGEATMLGSQQFVSTA